MKTAFDPLISVYEAKLRKLDQKIRDRETSVYTSRINTARVKAERSEVIAALRDLYAKRARVRLKAFYKSVTPSSNENED